MSEENQELTESGKARLAAVEQIAQEAEVRHQAEIEANKVYSPEEPAAEVEATEEVKEEPAKKLVTVKVDGEELQVPEDEIFQAGIRYYQKDRTADKRLQEASKQLHELQQYRQQITQPSTDAAKVPSEELDARALARALQLGDEDEAAKAIEKIRGSHQSSGLNPDQIEERVSQRVQAELAKAEAYKKARDTFGEVFNDPYLMNIAAAEEDRLRQSGDLRNQEDIWSDIAGRLKKYAGFSNQTETMEDRKARKEAVTVPEPASARQQAQPTEKPLTTNELIEEMRSKRQQGSRKVSWPHNSGPSTRSVATSTR